MDFTLRNKKGPAVIVTYSQAVMAVFLAARPDSVSLAIAKHAQDYKTLTGKVLRVDHEQDVQLMRHFGSTDGTSWISPYSSLPREDFHVVRMFTDGYLKASVSADILGNLKIAERFFEMVDRSQASAAKAD